MWDILIPIIVGVVCGAGGWFGGYWYRRNIAEAKVAKAEDAVKQMIDAAQKRAETIKKETILEAKEEVYKLKSENERENRERRNEIQRSERRLLQKEELLDKKIEAIEQREENAVKKQKEIEASEAEINELKAKQLKELETISGMSMDEAKDILLESVEHDARHEAALMLREIEQKTKEEADKRARNIVSLAIQRCAADHVAETTVSVVALPNDEMKGRIIGREGRNIRTLETATGVDLIIDDTPEAVILSGFDPVRREVARIALEKLIMDGRIHPGRIEEMVEKARKEVDVQIGADVAKKYRENNQVINAIMAHHGDVEPATVEAVLVQAADAISAARPGARRETLENYIKRLEKLEEIANSFEGVDKSFAIQAGREIRIIVKPENVNDADTIIMAKEIVKRIETELEYPGQIKVNVIRETRAVEFAK